MGVTVGVDRAVGRRRRRAGVLGEGAVGVSGHGSGRNQVDEGEDDDPDDVDEVPVQADHLDRLGLVAGTPALRSIMPIGAISMMMPTDTCTPWKPVSV